jgi:branched-chain amino acid transport system ATP-binding protein
MTGMTSGIDVVHVRAGYGAVEALHDVTVGFPLGSVIALLGHNGAGKSSLLRVIAGTLAVSSGHVTWMGRDITRLSPNRRVAAGWTVVPDDPNVFLDLSVAENLALFGAGAAPDAVYAAFPELAGKGGQRAGTLSGGERQMLALGRLLLRPGAAVLLDEASSGLSAGAVERLYGVLGDLASPERTIVVVEQYQTDILRRADLIYVLARGGLAWAGERSELITGPMPAALR